MYARAVSFVLGPDKEWEAERIADVVMGLFNCQSGFIKASFLMDYGTGEFQWIAYWESYEALVSSKVLSQFREMIESSYQWEPMVQEFKVYEPTTKRT